MVDRVTVWSLLSVVWVWSGNSDLLLLSSISYIVIAALEFTLSMKKVLELAILWFCVELNLGN